MKNIYLCDNGKYIETAHLCDKYAAGIEVQAFYDPEYLSGDPAAVQKHLLKLKNIHDRSMHGTFADLCFGSFDKLIKEATRTRFEYSYDTAQRLGAKHLILHHGYVPGTSNCTNWIKRGITFWNDFFKEKSDDITVHLENLLEKGPELLSEMIVSVNDPRLNVCLDVGHVNCHSSVPATEWIKILNKQIGYVHLHNNNGKTDEHKQFTDGTLPLSEVCNALNEYSPDAIWAIETHTADVEASIEWLHNNKFWH